jgi:hypothetical protein
MAYLYSEYRFSIGKLNMHTHEEGEETFSAIRIVTHPSFTTYGSMENDIALVRLRYAIQFTDKIKPIPIAPANYKPSGESYGTWRMMHWHTR